MQYRFSVLFTLFGLMVLSACGGGGGGGSTLTSPPPPPPSGMAANDTLSLEEDNPAVVDVLDNDTDIAPETLAIATHPEHGEVMITSEGISYTPDLNFVGSDSFEYSVESNDGTMLTASVSVTVTAITTTTQLTETHSIPMAGYVSGNDAELGAAVLASPPQELSVPPNTVSLLLSLTGEAADIDDGGLFISSLTPPSGAFASYQRDVHFCFGGSCSSLVPRSPAYRVEQGVWTYQLGTLADTLDGIDLSSLNLSLTMRTGPDPDLSSGQTALFLVRPFVTADSVPLEDIDKVLLRLQSIAADNQLTLELEPPVVLADARFDEVSFSFLDPDTKALVQHGGQDSVNLFFIEDFSDHPLLDGISGGIPGSLGSNDGHNGVLIDALSFSGVNESFYVRETAELTFHEMGHLLGLYHTTEQSFSAVDVIDDTPICEEAVHDENEDGIAGLTECPDGDNPMFWVNGLLNDWESLTEGQKHVLFYSPLAVPSD